ncbi:MAG: ATP-binding cassette domain-containing protein [Syntrophales bacterium]|jgi:phospholipid/cholesterol/gamma-HCH transport system ATP-binding protein|nr:ATP-binding cassette domain-containing protein [Syntrophales bacterium]
MAAPFIEFRNITKRFGSLAVLEDVNFQIYEGEVTTIIGLSGSGKSVLLKHIIGLLKPDSGIILFEGKPLNEMSKGELKKTLSQVSYMFQGNALFDSMTVYENIALPLRETTNMTKAEIDKKVSVRIEQTELTEAAQRYPSELSGGMQKRAALARVLVTDPKVVLFDEPTTGQDPVRKNAILSMIAQYQRKFGFTAILVSHEIPDVYFISNRILALYQKKIVFQGSPEEFEDFDHPFQTEVIRSLEGLQHELTGMYSKRQFKMQNHARMKRTGEGDIYAVLVHTLREDDSTGGKESHEEVLKGIEHCVAEYFTAAGGFSTRLKTDEFVTVLPYSNIAEAEDLARDFVDSLKVKTGGRGGVSGAGHEHDGKGGNFALLTGIAEGFPADEIETVIASARSQQKETTRLHCDARR